MALWVASASGSTGAGTVATMERVGVVTRGEQPSTYTPEEKAALLAVTSEPGARVLLTAQRHGISPGLLHRWRR